MVVGRVEAAGYVANNGDAQIVSELVDEIRDAVTDYQVRDNPKLFTPPTHPDNLSRWCTSRPYMIRIFN